MELRSYPVSARYEQYERRAMRIAARIRWIKRHMILVILAAIAVLGLIFWFLGTVGAFTQPLKCADYVYGDRVEPSCRAFLSHPIYEYQAENSDIWSQDAPIFPGNYRIRAYTKGIFGKIRYSDTISFTIFTRDLRLSIPDSTYFYGDMSEELVLQRLQIQGLAHGDSIADTVFSLKTGENGLVDAAIEDFTILHESGIPVKDCYRVSLSGGSFTMLPRPITVSTQSARKEYDGQSWQEGSAAVTSGSLVSGDRLDYMVPELPADAGVHEIDANYRIVNTDGQDVTHLYDVKLNRGKLTVQPRKLSITTGSAQKTYDGKDLTCKEWELTAGQVVQGHTLQVDMISKRKNYGESFNEARILVEDASRRDVSANYDVQIIHGKLTVDPIVLKIKTESASKVYDGEPLMAPGKLVEGQVLKGHKISIKSVYGRVDVGTAENIPEVIITDKNGNDVTAEGYRIEVDMGILTVTPRPITVTSKSAQKLYDGTPLVCHEYSITSGSLGKRHEKEVVGIENFTGQQTEVGSSENVFNILIYTTTGHETTHNYEITYVYGTLTVLENPDYQPPDDPPGNATIPGNGNENGSSYPDPSDAPQKPGSDTQITFPSGGGNDNTPIALIESIDGIRGGETVYLRFQSYGNYTLTGWTAAKPAPGFINEESPLKWVGRSMYYFGNTPAKIRLTRLSSCPVLIPTYTYDENKQIYNGNDCYFHDSPDEMELYIYPYFSHDELVGGSLYVGIRELEPEYRKYVYEHYLDVPQTTRRQLLQWAEAQGIHKDSLHLVRDIQMAVLGSASYNSEADPYPAGVDVVMHFLTVAQEGICQHFASAATLLFRTYGIPARYTVGYAPSVNGSGITNVTGLDAHAWVEIYVDGIGWVPIEVTPGGTGGAGGMTLEIAGYSATKVYDGKPFDLSNIHSYRLEGGYIRKGHRIEVTYKDVSRFTEQGNYDLKVESYRVFDQDGKDVTSLYDIEFGTGKLTILLRPITITTGSATKKYDGLPLTCMDYWISSGSLLPGHEVIVELGSSITEPGQIANEIVRLKIVDSQGRSVAKYYRNTTERGLLTVTP